jgi:O-antigen/teichoic acid export membrane protein
VSTVTLSAENVNAAVGATRRLVARNTIYLSLSQVLAMPITVLSNAVAAHYLGAEAFGYAYLATTLCTFGFLAVGWGHDAVLPAVVARDHRLAGLMLGSSIAWRVVASVVVYAVLATSCYLLRYPAELQWALGLTALLTALIYIVAACKDTIRGLERTDIPAYVHFGQQLLATVFVIAVLMLGGKLRLALLAHSVAGAVVIAAMWPTLRPVGVGALQIRWETVKELFLAGAPFVVFGIAMELQPNIDAIFLSKLAPVEVMGWYAVSRRLVGTLLLPATTLIGALYPTLCRLQATDSDGFKRTANDALLVVGLVAIPMGLGCALFPEIGVALFSRAAFRPAEDNLRILSLLVVLVYLSMPLGTCILAAGRQRAWSLVQCLCVVSSLILDPLLVPLFQRYTGNGGLGLCIAAVVSETMMLAFGIALVPAGILDKKLLRYAGLAIVSGGAMAIVGLAGKPLLGAWIAAPLAMAAYVGALWATGGIDNQQIAAVRRAIGRKIPRLASQSSGS